MATYDVGDLSKGLLFQIFRTLVLPACNIDRDELVRNPLLLEDCGHSLSASRLRHAIELQNHDGDVFENVYKRELGCGGLWVMSGFEQLLYRLKSKDIEYHIIQGCHHRSSLCHLKGWTSLQWPHLGNSLRDLRFEARLAESCVEPRALRHNREKQQGCQPPHRTESTLGKLE